ncbi:hypothetical protein [Rhodococcus erythropolis]|uniref:hypothetical protein n=1 Tax=Rhodococcus erythropolis TaxID=1833 RepID=UPI00036C5105|nr:hypothetical protein [Rhodococcus erythropolis]ORI27773.1 hypothetical protein BH686_05300 [Rhodococcus erythropolis]
MSVLLTGPFGAFTKAGTSVTASAVTSRSISTRLVPPASVTRTVTPASHWPSFIFAQNFKAPSRYPDMYSADVFTRMLT